MRDFSEQKYSLSMLPEQKLQFSLAMGQSLDVLQMPIEELSSWLEKQIEQNPLLNWKDSYYRKKGVPLEEIDIAYEPSLFEHLMQQARERFTDNLALKQIEWIIGNLENTGFFTESLDNVFENWNPEDLLSLLHELQQFDPPGIGARNLQESLLLQLKALGKEKNLSYRLIQDHLDDLLQGRISLIQKKYHVDEKTIKQTIYSEIASLDPFPGLRFQKKINSFLVPDVFLLEEDLTWKIEINEEKLPAYSIQSFSKDESFLNNEDTIFFKKHLNQAHWIDCMIEKRRQTLYKVTKHIVQAQINYLKGESSFLRPLKIKEVAEELSLHESTITRTVNNKYLSCKRGIISLKSLFSSQLGKGNIEESFSSDQAQKLLQKLVAEENKKHPLSDREILEKMLKVGIPCARRTVTKYRQSLDIPSRRFRKKSTL